MRKPLPPAPPTPLASPSLLHSALNAARNPPFPLVRSHTRSLHPPQDDMILESTTTGLKRKPRAVLGTPRVLPKPRPPADDDGQPPPPPPPPSEERLSPAQKRDRMRRAGLMMVGGFWFAAAGFRRGREEGRRSPHVHSARVTPLARARALRSYGEGLRSSRSHKMASRKLSPSSRKPDRATEKVQRRAYIPMHR